MNINQISKTTPMNIIKNLLFILTLVSIISCNSEVNSEKEEQKQNQIDSVSNERIKVLNVGTFHMGSTSDSKTVEFDEKDKKKQEEAKKIAEMIAKFKPTVICVEREPTYNEELNEKYQEFLEYSKTTSYGGEIGLIAFEVGRLSNISKLYGIDHQMGYNYNINQSLENDIDSTTYNEFMKSMFASIPNTNPFEKGISLKEKLKRINQPKFLDLMIVANADILTYVGTEDGFEGADEASKYYKRNLRMYSNLNRLNLDKTDRVFILLGASHTGFLNKFLNRSPKYEVVNVLDYIK